MYKVYQVLPGEELENISVKLHIELDVLKALNGLDDDYRVMPGNNLVVPNVDDNNFQRYIIRNGDTLFEIGRRFQVSPEILAMINGLKMDEYIYAGEELIVPASGVSLYISLEGDTLEEISSKASVDVRDIINHNENLYLLPEQLVVLKKEKFL